MLIVATIYGIEEMEDLKMIIWLMFDRFAHILSSNAMVA